MLSFNNFKEIDQSALDQVVKERQSLIKREFEHFLQQEAQAVDERVSAGWNFDYSSIENFLTSVEPQRQEWRDCLGVWSQELDPLTVELFPYFEDETCIAHWIILSFKGNLRCHAALAYPKERSERLPLVIAQHGAGSTPEHIFGLIKPHGAYHSYGRHLVDAGYAVLAPQNVLFGPPRSRLHRMALLLGTTLAGLEIRKFERLLDYVETLPDIDSERIAMWGLSWGGFYTLTTLPVEPRIKVGINAAFFNHRVSKMLLDDPLFSSFVSGGEQGEHAYIPGWLTKFRDSELMSLACPRPVQIQAGKADSISWHPLVVEEFERSKVHYEKLGVADRLELLLHEGGHEIKVNEGLDFLAKWL